MVTRNDIAQFAFQSHTRASFQNEKNVTWPHLFENCDGAVDHLGQDILHTWIIDLKLGRDIALVSKQLRRFGFNKNAWKKELTQNYARTCDEFWPQGNHDHHQSKLHSFPQETKARAHALKKCFEMIAKMCLMETWPALIGKLSNSMQKLSSWLVGRKAAKHPLADTVLRSG